MTWTHIHCDLPVYGSEEAEKYIQHREAWSVAEREQVIVTTQQGSGWIATLAGDWRSGTGATEERAIGELWLLYAHEIIEKCKALGK